MKLINILNLKQLAAAANTLLSVIRSVVASSKL